MVLKRLLNVSISLSLALSPLATMAQAQTIATDPVVLLLQSLKTENPDEAARLIQKARERLTREKLPEETLEKINALLERAQAKVKQNQQQRPAPQSSKFLGPAKIDLNIPDDDITKLLKENPEVRTTMYEIGQGRMIRDSLTIEDIIKNSTGKTPGQIDFEDSQKQSAQDQFGSLVAVLEKAMLIDSPQNIAFDNLVLRDKYPDLDTDELANKLVWDYTQKGFLAGMVRRVAKNYKIIGGEFGGVAIEAVATFAVSANLMLRLANLYDIRLSAYDKQTLLLGIISMAKAAVVLGLPADNNPQNPVSKVADAFGSKLGKLRGAGQADKAPQLLKRLLGQPMIGGALKEEIAAINSVNGGLLGNDPASLVNGPATATSQPGSSQVNPNGPAMNGQATAVNGPGTALNGPATGEPPQKPIEKPEAPKDLKTRAKQAGVAAFWMTVSGTLSGLQTFIVGKIAQRTLLSMYREERAANNESFRRFMMTPDGEGFLKLLVLSMNVGKLNLDPIDVNNPTDDRVKYILSLARSARVCSETDKAALTEATDKYGNVVIDKKQFEILRYACDSKLSQARLTRLYTEFATFNEIPQEALPDLRIAGRNNRLRMGEIIVQLQMLDGDRNPEEIKFFNMIVSKYLGFEDNIDKNYFKRLQSYIIDNNGMRAEAMSPTGFTINTREGERNPYDMTIGYMTTSGPDLPPGIKRTPPVQPVTPVGPVFNPPGTPTQPGTLPGFKPIQQPTQPGGITGLPLPDPSKDAPNLGGQTLLPNK